MTEEIRVGPKSMEKVSVDSKVNEHRAEFESKDDICRKKLRFWYLFLVMHFVVYLAMDLPFVDFENVKFIDLTSEEDLYNE